MCQPICKSPLFCESKVSIVLIQSSMYRGDWKNGSGQNGMDKMACRQNGIGQNGMDKMVQFYILCTF